MMDKSRTSVIRSYCYQSSQSRSQPQYESSSSRVPSSSSYDYKYEGRSSSHNYRERDSPGRTVSSGPATKRDDDDDDTISKDSKLYVRSYGDWDELLSATSNKTYFYNRVTKKSQWTKPDEKTDQYVRSYGDWEELVSSTSNKTYYYNRITKKSQWSKPDEVVDMESRSKYSSKYDDRYREDDKYRDKYRGEDKYRDDDRYRENGKHREDDEYRDDGRHSRTDNRYREPYEDDRYRDDLRYKEDRGKDDDRKSVKYREEDRKEYYHRSEDQRRDKYRDDDRYDELGRSSLKSSTRRKDYYVDDDLVDRSRKYDKYYSPGRSETSQTRKYTYYSPPSSDPYKKNKLTQESSQSSYRSRGRERSSHRDDDDYDRRGGGADVCDDKYSKSTRNNSAQSKPNNNNNNHRHGSVAGSSTTSPPSDSDSKSDELDDQLKVRTRLADKEDIVRSSKDRGNYDSRSSPARSDQLDDRPRKTDHRSNDTNNREKVEIQSPEKRRRSLTPLADDERLKRPKTSNHDGNNEGSRPMTPPAKRTSPENKKSSNGISLSPSHVSKANLQEIIAHLKNVLPGMSQLQKMNDEEALKTIQEMLQLLKEGHLKQQNRLRQNESKSGTSSPSVKVALNSVHHGSNNRTSSLSKPKAGERTRSVYDNLKKQSDIKDDLNRLLPSSRSVTVPSPPSESSDSCSRSPRSDLVSRPSRGLLIGSNSTSVNPSTKSISLSSSSNQVLPSITPSLVACFKEDLISHVQGWPADGSERQAKKYADEAHNLGSLNCTRVSAELKMARSLVRLTEIQATLQEQRILFVRHQIKDVEEWKGNQSSANVAVVVPPPASAATATISGIMSSSSSSISSHATSSPSTLGVGAIKQDNVHDAHNNTNNAGPTLINIHT